MNKSRAQLAEYQAQILDLLHESESAEEATKLIVQLTEQLQLAEKCDIKPDVRMVDVAMNLTRKWGVRRKSEQG